jgi:hypothetical protein
LGVDEGGAGLDDFIAHMLPFSGLQQREDAEVEKFKDREASDRAVEGKSGTDFANVAGQIASPVNFVPVGDVGAGVGLTEKLAKLAGQGAVSGAAAPTDPQTGNYLMDKFKQIGEGAAASGAGGAILHGFGRAIQNSGSTASDMLRKEGVTMTPGQALGGIPKRFEDAAAKFPVVGNVIRGAQNRSLESFNVAAVNRALAPIGEVLPKGVKAGNDAISYARQKIGETYDALNSRMIGKLDAPFLGEIQNLSQMAKNLPMQQRSQFGRILQDEVLSRFTPLQTSPLGNALALAGQSATAANGAAGGVTTGQTIKEIESTLGRLAKGMMRSDDYDTQKLGGGVKELQQAVIRMRDRVNPQYAGEIQKANAAYANFKRIQRAASSDAAKNGVFTPAHLLNAAKAGDFSKDKRAFSEGDALMQDLAAAGKEVLPNSIADSGTAERLMWAGLPGAGVTGALMNPLATLGTAVGAAAAAVPYTSGGMALLSKFGGPATRNYLASLAHGATPYVAGGLRTGVTDGANQPGNQ